MSISSEIFIQQYQQRVGAIKPERQQNLRLLLGFINQDGLIKEICPRAYLLATVRHETADTFAPMIERGNPDYFLKYEPGTRIGKSLGNLEKGDGFLFRGRGYVQITGRANYHKLSTTTNRNLVETPEDACQPEVAYKIASRGMMYGLFTGAALDRYINFNGADYFNARRVINGLDRALKIADYAKLFEELLRLSS